ncbi:O-antigen ligase family protein [Aminipila terrae]|uniref:O-antigen ligase-related domain-containing protein n=1 Tax=Aminipila terrae TaxID=2697030 RepID=A0A6P1MHI1_9FIRM|nr:O-antigen ligase family protein [Aminipila terrae]QHI72044.1 hypothetical protein Ami3637_06210 [Aminipila terrae]
MTKKLTYLPAVFTILLIFSTAMAGSFDLTVQKWTALAGLLVILILMLTPKAKHILTAYTVPLLIAVTGYAIWNGISIFYSDIPKTALFEFTKLIIALTAFFTILAFTAPTKKNFKIVSAIIAITTAFFGIISVDAASNGPFASIFKAFMEIFTDSMKFFGVFENGIRITGIFGNANTFSGFAALGILFSLFLVMNSNSKKGHAISLILLAINSLTYLLLFSMGSMFIFFISCILMIISSKKEERFSTFVLMAETAIITTVFTGFSLITLGSSPFIPLLAIVLNALFLWVVDKFLRQPLSNKLMSNTKTSLYAGIIIVVFIIGYLIAAFNVTGPLTLSPNETVMRAAYLDTGLYKLNATIDSNDSQGGSPMIPTVRITTQNETNLKLHTSTELYNGSLDNAQFTVPKDSKIVKLYITGSPNGNLLDKLTYTLASEESTNSQSGSIKLGYKLFPEIAANRIQDLGANENSIQRLVFFEDGLKLFKQSPLIGKGLGGYETGVSSVQNFYYETNYVHNHYIEALCDLGIIGFAFFMSILVLCVIALLKLFKQSKASNYKNAAAFALPLMTACLFQMFGQAGTDAVWSAGPFLVIAFSVLALLIIANSSFFTEDNLSAGSIFTSVNKSAAEGSDSKKNITGPLVLKVIITSVTIVMAVLLCLNLYASGKAASGNCTMEQIASLSKIDKFESNDYKTTYIVTTSTYGLVENLNQANKFAKDMSKNTDISLNYLLPFYFNTGQNDKLFKTADLAIQNQKASPNMWNRLFEIFDTAIDSNREDPVPVLLHLFKHKEYYIEGVLDYYKDLQKRNDTYLDDVMLVKGNVAFIGKLLALEPLDQSQLLQAMDVFSKTIFDSQYAVDANKDGIPDNVSALSGSTVWGKTATGKASASKGSKFIGSGFDGSMTASAGTTMELQSYCVKGGEYTVRLAGLTGLNGAAAPRDITASVDGQPLTVQYDSEGAFVKVPLKGAIQADKAKNIEAAPASTEKITVSFPTGGQMTKITLKK